MNQYYVTTEVRLAIKADDEDQAKQFVAETLGQTPNNTKVTITGCDIIYISKER